MNVPEDAFQCGECGCYVFGIKTYTMVGDDSPHIEAVVCVSCGTGHRTSPRPVRIDQYEVDDA